MSIIDHPDGQAYAQWFGPMLYQANNGPWDPGGTSIPNTLTVSNFSALVVLVYSTSGGGTVQVDQSKSDATSALPSFTSQAFPVGNVTPLVFPLTADQVDVSFLPGYVLGHISYQVYGSNVPLTGFLPLSDAEAASDLQGEAVYIYNGSTFDRLREANADALSATGMLGTAPMLRGSSTFDRQRGPDTLATRANAAVVAGTPQTLWAGSAGLTLNLLVGQLSLSVAGQILLKEAGTEFLRSPQLQAGGVWDVPYTGWRYHKTAVAGAIQVDVSANGNVGGWVGGTVE